MRLGSIDGGGCDVDVQTSIQQRFGEDISISRWQFIRVLRSLHGSGLKLTLYPEIRPLAHRVAIRRLKGAYKTYGLVSQLLYQPFYTFTVVQSFISM
jgi:hypothetical protein